MSEATQGDRVRRRIAFVLWSGELGGAERHSVAVCRVMRDLHGIDARIVFIGSADRAVGELRRCGIPWTELGMNRGRSVVALARSVAEAVSAAGPDGAYLVYGGYLAHALRYGGYRGPLISVEHGGILQLAQAPPLIKAKEALSRRLGEGVLDATICVSEFVREVVVGYPHARVLQTIYNGVDTELYVPAVSPGPGDEFTVGFAGRLIEGKGILHLVRAFEPTAGRIPCRLEIAGTGPALEEARSIVASRGVGASVSFHGVVGDMPSFWRSCSVVVQPTDGWVESFCLSVAEGMACGLPAVVSDQGALPDVLGGCGIVVRPGNEDDLRAALGAYATDPRRCRRDGEKAHRRAFEAFDIRATAASYLALLDRVSASRAVK